MDVIPLEPCVQTQGSPPLESAGLKTPILEIECCLYQTAELPHLPNTDFPASESVSPLIFAYTLCSLMSLPSLCHSNTKPPGQTGKVLGLHYPTVSLLIHLYIIHLQGTHRKPELSLTVVQLDARDHAVLKISWYDESLIAHHGE